MCGRYTIITPTKELAAHFGLIMPNEPFRANADARPTQNLPIVLDKEPNKLVLGHWGYPMKIGGKDKELINIRAETIVEKPYFRKAAEKHRCIILADGFYEWKKIGDKKQKFLFVAKHGPVAFAGIYQWKEKTLSNEMRPFFTIITAPPNDFMSDYHDRMPVILQPGKELQWLTQPFEDKLLASYKGEMRVQVS